MRAYGKVEKKKHNNEQKNIVIRTITLSGIHCRIMCVRTIGPIVIYKQYNIVCKEDERLAIIASLGKKMTFKNTTLYIKQKSIPKSVLIYIYICIKKR